VISAGNGLAEKEINDDPIQRNRAGQKHEHYVVG